MFPPIARPPTGAAALRVMTEPQEGAGYAQLLGLARAAEAAGWDGFFRSDHLLTIGPGGPRDAPEAWTTLAALARETERLRLGTLVSPATFRHPAILARMAATVDQLSGGRVELGVGAGWFEAEHVALGIPLPPMAERMDRFEEATEVLVALLTGRAVDHEGRHFVLRGGVSLPRPLQERMPIIVGGHGGRRSARIAARFASEYNTTMAPAGRIPTVFAAVRAACEAGGRDPATMTLSWMGPCITGADLPAVRRRCMAFAGWLGPGAHDPDSVLAAMRERGIAGTYDEAAARMCELREAGCQRFYFQLLDLEDVDSVAEIAALVATPALGGPAQATSAAGRDGAVGQQVRP